MSKRPCRFKLLGFLKKKNIPLYYLHVFLGPWIYLIYQPAANKFFTLTSRSVSWDTQHQQQPWHLALTYQPLELMQKTIVIQTLLCPTWVHYFFVLPPRIYRPNQVIKSQHDSHILCWIDFCIPKIEPIMVVVVASFPQGIDFCRKNWNL